MVGGEGSGTGQVRKELDVSDSHSLASLFTLDTSIPPRLALLPPLFKNLHSIPQTGRDSAENKDRMAGKARLMKSHGCPVAFLKAVGR